MSQLSEANRIYKMLRNKTWPQRDPRAPVAAETTSQALPLISSQLRDHYTVPDSELYLPL